MVTQEMLPTQFLAVKDDDERFMWIGEPDFFPFVCTGIPFLLFGLIWGAIDYFVFIRNMKIIGLLIPFFEQHLSPSGGSILNIFRLMIGLTIPFLALHLFPCWLSILNIFRLILVHKNTFYAISNKRIMMRSGFWGIDFNAIDYDKISDIQVTVNPIENLLGVGTIRFSAGKVSSKGDPLTHDFIAVQKPYDVFKQVKTVMVDVKTDWNYPNKLRPDINPGYNTEYEPRKSQNPGSAE